MRTHTIAQSATGTTAISQIVVFEEFPNSVVVLPSLRERARDRGRGTSGLQLFRSSMESMIVALPAYSLLAVKGLLL